MCCCFVCVCFLFSCFFVAKVSLVNRLQSALVFQCLKETSSVFALLLPFIFGHGIKLYLHLAFISGRDLVFCCCLYIRQKNYEEKGDVVSRIPQMFCFSG